MKSGKVDQNTETKIDSTQKFKDLLDKYKVVTKGGKSCYGKKTLTNKVLKTRKKVNPEDHKHKFKSYLKD